MEQNNKLGKDYYNSHIPVVNERIRSAGIRLAGLLNQLLSNVAIQPTAAEQPLATVRNNFAQIRLEDADKHIGESVSISGKVYSHRNMGRLITSQYER